MNDHRAPLTVKIGDAKTRLSELIARVEKGEEIIIARDDKPVVKLVRIRRQADIIAAVGAIREMRKRMKPVTTEELIEWKNEGRR